MTTPVDEVVLQEALDAIRRFGQTTKMTEADAQKIARALEAMDNASAALFIAAAYGPFVHKATLQ